LNDFTINASYNMTFFHSVCEVEYA
jgi:hypothetical protein